MKRQQFTRNAIALACASFLLPTVQAATGTACQSPVSRILFSEDFSTALDPAKWTVNSTGGSVVSGGGKVIVTGTGSSRFPYIQAIANPIPTTGDFSFYCKARYLTSGSNGDGACVISQKVFTPGSDSIFDIGSVVNLWNDDKIYTRLGVGFSGWVTDNNLSNITSDTTVHDFEVCFIGSTVSLYKDNVQVASSTLPNNWIRPKYIWFGNPVFAGNNNWSSFETNKIEVRALGSASADTPSFTISPANSVIAGTTIKINIENPNINMRYKLFFREENAAFSDSNSIYIEPGQEFTIDWTNTYFLAIKSYSGNYSSNYSDEIKFSAGKAVTNFMQSFSDYQMIASQSFFGDIHAEVDNEGMILLKSDRTEAVKAIFHDSKTGNVVKEYLVPARVDGVLTKTSSAYGDLIASWNPAGVIQFLQDGTTLEVNTLINSKELPPNVSITYITGTKETIIATYISNVLKGISMAIIGGSMVAKSPDEAKSLKALLEQVRNEFIIEILKDADLLSKLSADISNKQYLKTVSDVLDWCKTESNFSGGNKCVNIAMKKMKELASKTKTKTGIYLSKYLNFVNPATKILDSFSLIGGGIDGVSLFSNAYYQSYTGITLIGFDMGFNALDGMPGYYRFNWEKSTSGISDTVLFNASGNEFGISKMDRFQFSNGSTIHSSKSTFNPNSVTSGTIDNTTLQVDYPYFTEDLGSVGYTFIWASVKTPNEILRFYKQADGNWVLMNNLLEDLKSNSLSRRLSATDSFTVFDNLNLSNYPGSSIYFGYGRGADEASARADMFKLGGKWRVIYRVK